MKTMKTNEPQQIFITVNSITYDIIDLDIEEVLSYRNYEQELLDECVGFYEPRDY